MPKSLMNRKYQKKKVFIPDVKHALIISCSNYSTGPFNIETGKANDQPDNEKYVETIEFFLKRYGFNTKWLKNPKLEDINDYMK